MSDCSFRWAGQYFDSETNLCYNRFRFYDSSTGSYISQDPIRLKGNNPTLYAYVYDPNIWIDLFGLELIYRGMKMDGGLPKVEASKRGLGTTPSDITVVDGNVIGDKGCMSVSPSIEGLPEHRKPVEYGGTGKDPVWVMDSDNLGPDLKYVSDSSTHGTIQPTKPMTPEEYQKSLADTQSEWSLCNG